MIILIIIINFVPFFKQAPPPLDIFERISGHQQKKAPPPFDIFERISGLAETSIATPWYIYFWDDFLFLQKYFQNLILFRYQIFWNRYFFRYHKFLKPIPILFSIPKFSKTDTNIIKKNQKVSKPRSFETKMPNSVSDALFIYCGGVGRTRGGGWGGVQIGIFVVFQWTHSFTPPFPSCCPHCHHCRRRIYSNIFEYLHRQIYSYSYSVFIFESNIFVFVFGFNFWTEYIRIRIRF